MGRRTRLDMNEWQKLGSGPGDLDVWKWVDPATTPLPSSGATRIRVILIAVPML